MRTENRLLIGDFQRGAAPGALFSHTPRLSIRDVFEDTSRFLPETAPVRVSKFEGKAGVAIYPFAKPSQIDGDPEPTRLAWRHFPRSQVAYITRVNVCDAQERGRGVGSAMFGSQYPLWLRMGIRAVTLLAHEGSEGFYRKLGFEPVASITEAPGDVLIPMRLDFGNAANHTAFIRAIVTAPPLTAFKLAL